MKEPRVVQADNAGLFALSGTRSFILGRRRVALVDPGPHEAGHMEALARMVEDAEEGTILLTHRHPDHAAGAPALSARLGFPVRSGRPAGALAHGDVITTDEGDLQVIATPGHSRDHVAYFLPDHGLLLAGDLILGEGSTTWVGEYPGCVADYLASLDRVAELPLHRILSAHGPPLDDPDEAIQRYRTHRLGRIAQVRRALEREPELSVEELVDRVYSQALPHSLREGARWSLRAILDHLGVAPFPRDGVPTESGGSLEQGT